MNRRDLLRHSALLLGGLVSASLTRAVLAGATGTDQVTNPALSDEQREAISALAELIVPRTDTPGAIDAGVPQFIELMVSDWYSGTERGIFFAGLKALDGFCEQHYGLSFLQCTPEQQGAALQQAERDASDYKGKKAVKVLPLGSKELDEHTPFFNKIKELTVIGYYTSELGAKQELSYNPMPMSYKGDYDFAEIGRQWSS